jgi:hypothetical protein
MAAARTWDPRTNTSAGSRGPDEEMWHVEIEPGEIKVLSLEQLDDLYRLDIISESTRLWQSGLRGWTRLGIVAGIEPEPAIVHPLPTRKPTNTIPPPPPLTPTPLRATPPPARLPPADDWVVSLPPLSSMRPVSLAPPVTSAPVPPSSRAPDSLRPIALNQPDLPVPRRKGGGGWLVALAVLSGLGITLYRNDVLRHVAHRYGQDRIYSRIEAAVGAPGFGTLRSLEQATAEASQASLNTALLPTASPSITPRAVSPSPAAPSLTTETKDGKRAVSAPGGPISVDALALEREKAVTVPADPAKTPPVAAKRADPKHAAPAKERKPEKVAAAKLEKPAIPATEAPAPAKPKQGKGALLDAIQSAARSPKAAAAPRSPAKPADIGIKGSRHEYDPLNPKL